MVDHSPVRPRTAVITGAPGAGKTTLLEMLAKRGWRVVSEVARAILREPGGLALRDDDPLGFTRAMIKREMADLAAAPDDGRWTIFDRGFFDSIAFLNLSGIRASPLAVPPLRYSGPIFVAAAWEKIYHSDVERIQDWSEAQVSGNAVTAAWTAAGYPLVSLPLGTPLERADFVESTLKSN